MGQQWILFKTAIMFFTRIHVGNLPYSKENLQASARYFSWVGVLVGLTGGLVLWASSFVFSPALSVLFSMLTTILLTGAFHEDGLSDTADGLGGGWEKDRILAIMKDSRVGSYGVIAIVMVLMLKLASLSDVATIWIPVLLVCGHAFSRYCAILIK